jgi:hypothetical protein
MPTTAAHDPAAVASASMASSSEVDPRTATVPPRRNPPQGNSSANSGRTGNTRVRSAGTALSPLATPTAAETAEDLLAGSSIGTAGADIDTPPHTNSHRGETARPSNACSTLATGSCVFKTYEPGVRGS